MNIPRVLILRVSMIVTVLLGLSFSPMYGQPTAEEVATAIQKLDAGRNDEVRNALPALSAKYPNDPGVIYLQGRLATDGIESVKAYQSIVDNNSKSEWADDALYRIYQYYFALGLYKTAELKMAQLKRDYPASSYINGKKLDTLPATEEERVNLPTKEIATAETLSAPTVVKETETREPYVLQTGAFSTVANAEKQKNYLEEKGYAVEITNKVRGGKGLYLVWLGAFRTAEQAKSVSRQIMVKYKIKSIVVERY